MLLLQITLQNLFHYPRFNEIQRKNQLSKRCIGEQYWNQEFWNQEGYSSEEGGCIVAQIRRNPRN